VGAAGAEDAAGTAGTAIWAGAAGAAGAEGATDTAGAAGAAGAVDKTRGSKGRGETKGGGIMAGEGERSPSRTEDATAPDIIMSPSMRATGEIASGEGNEGGGPEEPQLLVVVAVAVASEIGGQGA
jgi:hypothetical protein